MRRSPKDSIKHFFSVQYLNHGMKYIKYLFGSKIARLFRDPASIPESIDVIAVALIVSPTANDFCKIFGMKKNETETFINIIKQIHDGQLAELPRFIHESYNEGLNILLTKLVRTGFLNESRQ